MFDVRPVDETGDLDWNKIHSIGVTEAEALLESTDNAGEQELSAKAYILGVGLESDQAPLFHDPNFRIHDYLPKEMVDRKKEDRKKEELAALEKLIEKRKLEQELRAKEQLKLQQEMALQAQQKRKELERLAELKKAEIEERNLELKAEKERKEQEKLLALEIERRKIQKQKEILEQLQQSNKEKEMALAEEKARLHAEREEKIRQEALERKSQLQKIAEFNRAQQLSYEESVAAERKRKQIELEEMLAKEKKEIEKIAKKAKKKNVWWFADKQKNRKRKENIKDALWDWQQILGFGNSSLKLDLRTNLAAFSIVALTLSMLVGGVSYASKGMVLKGKVLGVSQDGYANLAGAVSDMAHQNFEQSGYKFSEALENFSQGSEDLEEMGSILISATRYIPFASKLSSGKNAMEAGKHFSAAGKSLNEVVKSAASLKDGNLIQGNTSLLDILQNAQTNISEASTELAAAQKNLDLISVDDLPKDKQEKFMLLKEKMPDILAATDLFLSNNHILVELLGGNGPRKYLFLFQNNTEMRATGGFIGSYGLLDIANGHVKNFFIDGIFNPDGQLRDRIVPPVPIQKISANWSMHDSNWFSDFPSSAQKAIYFYERTGGPTADGVITLTPTVLQKLLEITGPIEMPEYDVTLDSENFIQLTQYEVEVDYDKQENKPKKILSDLAPLVMEKLLSSKDMDTISRTANALLEGLSEKHILLYSQNSELEKLISERGWSGEVLPSSKDYVSVINTNINGFKTDAVVEENISHKAEIQSDGSIVDTLTVTRKHTGGSSQYEWLNKVNADYMRVYVPEGSKLLEVSGQTRETVNAPVDYDELGFKRDAEVEREEKSITVDEQSGTRIYSESGKTVFGNWVYVSPGESVTVTYKYVLPFSLFQVLVNGQQQIDSYALVAQKQSGSLGSGFESEISYPANYELKWNFPENSEKAGSGIKSATSLKTDRYFGAVFEKND